jgi:hypothetical protein
VIGVHETSTWPADILRHTCTSSPPQLNGHKDAVVTSTDDNFREVELAEVGQTSVLNESPQLLAGLNTAAHPASR